MTIVGLLLTAATTTAAAKPKLWLSSKPTVVAPGATLTVSGRVRGKTPRFTRGLRVVLEEQAGKRWKRRAAVRPTRKLSFSVKWRVPKTMGKRFLRIRLLRKRRVLASTRRWRLKVTRAQGNQPAPSPAPSPPNGPRPPGSQTPPPESPIVQSVTFVPRAATTVLKAGQLAAANNGEIVLASGVARPEPGKYLYGSVTPTSAAYLIRVVDVTNGPNGTTVVTGEDAQIDDAFSDYDVTYKGPLSRLGTGQSRLLGRSLARSVGLSFGTEAWSCSTSTGGPVSILPDVDVDLGDPIVNFDVDVAERSMDFFLKGSLTVKARMDVEGEVSCTAKSPKTPGIPLGSTGLEIAFQSSATLTFSVEEPDDETHTLDASTTVRVATGYSVYGGETNKLAAGSVTGTLETNGVRASLSFGWALQWPRPSC